MSIMGKTSGGAVRIYQITYLFGLVLASILYLAVNKFFPPEGLEISEDFDGQQLVVTDGIEAPNDVSRALAKESETSDKQLSEDLKI